MKTISAYCRIFSISRVFLILCISLLLVNCAPEKVVQPPPTKDPIELRVENQSKTVIDLIRAKPCSMDNKYYKTQAERIKPTERVMLHIYQQCVDLVALDAFGNVMDQIDGLQMNSDLTWLIK